jgi:hypothetical protein
VYYFQISTGCHIYLYPYKKAKGLGKEGSITINFSKVKAADGSTVPIRSTKNAIQGENKGGASVTLVLVSSPLFLLKKGKEAKIPEGKIANLYVDKDVSF